MLHVSVAFEVAVPLKLLISARASAIILSPSSSWSLSSSEMRSTTSVVLAGEDMTLIGSGADSVVMLVLEACMPSSPAAMANWRRVEPSEEDIAAVHEGNSS